jgi:AcrR family transcriptional regulator
MGRQVKRKAYDATGRSEASRRRRHAILVAARSEFAERGYVRVTMSSIARRAGVALDTVYELVGRKPELFRLLIETAISGEDEAVTATDRDYVQAIGQEPTATGKLAIYAAAMRRIQARLAPLLAVLQQAAGADDDLARLWREISDRRATNMRLFAADVAAAQDLRVPVEAAADIIWATNSPEVYLLLVGERGWDPDHYQRWLADTWERVLLS